MNPGVGTGFESPSVRQFRFSFQNRLQLGFESGSEGVDSRLAAAVVKIRGKIKCEIITDSR